MDKKLLIRIEEALNRRTPNCVMQKLDADIHGALEDAIKKRGDGQPEETLYSFVCKKLKEQNFVKKSKLLDEAGFYTYAQISSNTWSNLRWGNGTPSKETLLKLIIGLRMNEADANKVMELGNNELRLSDPRDRLVLALIDIRCYDIYTVYDAMEEYGKHGAKPFANIYHFTE